MTTNLQQEIDKLIEHTSQSTRLDTLIEGYRLCAHSEGKSEKT